MWLKLRDNVFNRHITLEAVDKLVDMIVAEAKPTDHILVMSNGSFGGIHQKILDRLK